MPRLLFVLAAAIIVLAPSSATRADQPLLLAQKIRAADKVFSDLERRLIREVLNATGADSGAKPGKGGKKAKGSKGAPAGLARRDRLPPGLEHQLERNGQLPPGLEKKAFPSHLRSQLPAPLRGTERVIIGNDAVLIDLATNVVLDIIRDVIVNQ
jgi:Ni/Co efflux regulator RcnB